MNIIIGKDTSKYVDKKDYIILNSICELKFYKGVYNLILDDVIINEEGYIEGRDISLDEILISIDVRRIISNNINDKLLEIGRYYKIPILHNTWKKLNFRVK